MDAVEKNRRWNGMTWHVRVDTSKQEVEEVKLKICIYGAVVGWYVLTKKFHGRNQKGHVGRQLLMLQVLPPLLHFCICPLFDRPQKNGKAKPPLSP